MLTKVAVEEEFETFFNIAWQARHMFRMYCKLYEESEDRINLLKKSASEFFGDLQKMWYEQVLLDICKLTDPCKGGNLTINYFLCKCSDKFSDDEIKRIKNLSTQSVLLKKARLPRNKLIAHIDRKATMNGKPLGGLSDEELKSGRQMYQMIEQFYDDLQEIVNVVSSKIYGDNSEKYLKFLDPTGNAVEELISLLEKAGKK